MATPVGQFRPWRLILGFVAVTVGLYSLVFLTPGSNTPKLGIDLQGGTRITLTAKSSDQSAPNRQSMQLARDIMERRVNGSGVAGAEVQIEGTNQLIVTVPGTQDLTNLTRSAQLNFRPVKNSVPKGAVVVPDVTPELEPTGATDAPSAEVPGTEVPGSEVPTTDAPATAVTETAVTETAVTETAVPETGVPDPAATESSQGLRGGPAFAQGARTTDVGTELTGTPEASATEPGTAVPATTDATAAPTVAFPASSDPGNPIQPQSSLEADWAAWETDIFSAMSSGLSCAQIAPFEGQDDPAKPLVSCDEDGSSMYLLGSTIIPGSEIDTANALLDQAQGWVVTLNFKSQGFNDWAAYTTSNIGQAVAFTLDGKVIVAPTIQSAITTSTQITGDFTQVESVDLANSLKFGALPLAFERSSSDSVTAELGLAYLRAGLIAGGIGLLLVVLYCLIYYRLLGVITILSLVLSFGLVYAVLVLLGRWINYSLDMAGVAGLIIAIGITADSFVVYFERIKDEVREGRTFRSAVPRGWVRARRTILSADAVSFLAAAVLYALAVGEVKGFAFTLGLSTVLDLVVVFLVTHPLVALASGGKVFSSPTWSGLGAVAEAGVRHRAQVAAVSAKGA